MQIGICASMREMHVSFFYDKPNKCAPHWPLISYPLVLMFPCLFCLCLCYCAQSCTPCGVNTSNGASRTHAIIEEPPSPSPSRPTAGAACSPRSLYPPACVRPLAFLPCVRSCLREAQALSTFIS
jgi:hypothetical protein